MGCTVSNPGGCNAIDAAMLLLRNGGGGGGVTPEELEAALAVKADKVTGAVAGNLAALDGNGNLVDSGVDPIVFQRRTLETWAEIQEVVRMGKIGQFLNAESSQLVVPISTGGEAAVNYDFDVLGIDEDVPVNPALSHVLTIQAHNMLEFGSIMFDPTQYLFAVTAEACTEYGWPATGMPAGTYNITIDHGSYRGGTTQDGTYQFTTTVEVPVGGGVRHTQIGTHRNDGNYSKANLIAGTFTTYAADRTTALESGLTTTEGNNGTNLGTTTASNPTYKVGSYINFSQRQAHGANRWSTSFLRQYLNSDEATMTFTPATIWSRPMPTLPEGFLHKLPAELKAVLGKVRKRYALPVADGYGYEDIEDTVNIVTMLDMNFGRNGSTSEGPVDVNGTVTRGTPYTHWTGAENADRIKYNSAVAREWWLGSSHTSYACNSQYVTSIGALLNYYSESNLGVVPSLHII